MFVAYQSWFAYTCQQYDMIDIFIIQMYRISVLIGLDITIIGTGNYVIPILFSTLINDQLQNAHT